MTTLSGLNWRAIAALALISSVMGASAHPGHDLLSHGVGHAVTSGYHLTILFLSGFSMIALAQIIQKRPIARHFLRAAGAIVLLLGFVLWVR